MLKFSSSLNPVNKFERVLLPSVIKLFLHEQTYTKKISVNTQRYCEASIQDNWSRRFILRNKPKKYYMTKSAARTVLNGFHQMISKYNGWSVDLVLIYSNTV